MATTYLYRDATGDVGVQKATISTWVKRSNVTEQQYIYFCGYTANYSSYNFYIRFETDGTLTIISNDGGVILNYNTNRVFRDTSGWYQIVVALDLTETGNDRCKLYVNGVLETSYATQTAMTGDQWITGKSGYRLFIGYSPDATTKVWNGLMSSFYYTDGYVYQASTFGETDATTGEWKINTAPSVTMGTLGFLVMDNGNTITDQSSNSNDLTLGAGTLTATEDCPSDVFATINPLASLPNTGVSTFSHGSTTCQGVNASYVNGGSSLQMTKGKFYCEVKYVATSDASRAIIGITQDVSEISRINQDSGSYNTFYVSSSGNKNIEGSDSSYGDSYTTGDIISIAFDLDNMKLYFAKNGAWQDSGDPESGATGTGAVSGMTAVASSFSGGYFFHSGSDSNSQNNTMSWNFGNGYFGTTIISSEGTNASGIGKFEYDVPAGYTALSTKGLNE